MADGDVKDLYDGGFPAWALPPDETGAGFARSVVKAVFGTLGLPAELTYDTAVALSELATNVHRHALGGTAPAGLPELWAYVRWGKRREVVLKVYDSAPWRGTISPGPLRPHPASEGGRGFEVVAALTAEHGGRWGIHRTRSRLGARPVPGKAVFVAMPIPADTPPPAPKPDRLVAEEMYALLAARGLGRMHGSYGYGMAVICVRAGVHIWIREDSLSYCAPGHGTARHPLSDAIEVVEQVVQRCEDLDAPPG
ncbi:MAG: putative anti-sigma regulatory factor, serine/threonine protein kinase [Actinomycetia bacterium]|nr:putative anti-sigma regulatory factor, serine/threonine protein kinase [Actinomycetes bacterium]